MSRRKNVVCTLRIFVIICCVVSGTAGPPHSVGQREAEQWLNGRNTRSISYYLGNIAKLLIGGNVGPDHPLVREASNSSSTGSPAAAGAVVAAVANNVNLTSTSSSKAVQTTLVPQSQSTWGQTGAGQGQNSPYFGTQSYVNNAYTNYHNHPNYNSQQQQQVSASASYHHQQYQLPQQLQQEQQQIGQAPKNIFVTFQTTPPPPPPPTTTTTTTPQPQLQPIVYHQPIPIAAPIVQQQPSPPQFTPYIIPASVYSPTNSVPSSPITAQSLTTYVYHTPPPPQAAYFQIQTTAASLPPQVQAEGQSLMRSSTIDGEIQGSPAKYIGSFMGEDEPYPMGSNQNVQYVQNNAQQWQPQTGHHEQGQVNGQGQGQPAQSINYQGATHYYQPQKYQEPQAAASSYHQAGNSYQAATEVIHFHPQNQQQRHVAPTNSYQFNQGQSTLNQFNQGQPSSSQFGQGQSTLNQFNQRPAPPSNQFNHQGVSNNYQVPSQWFPNFIVPQSQPQPSPPQQQTQFRPPPPLPSPPNPPPPQPTASPQRQPQNDGEQKLRNVDKIKTSAVRQPPTSGKSNGVGTFANTLNSISNYLSKFKIEMTSNRRIDEDPQFDDSMRMDPSEISAAPAAVNFGQTNHPVIQQQQQQQQQHQHQPLQTQTQTATPEMSLPLSTTRQQEVTNFQWQNNNHANQQQPSAQPQVEQMNTRQEKMVNGNFPQNYYNYIDSFRALQIPMENESPVEFYDDAPINNEGLPPKSGRVTPAVAIYHASYMSY